MSTFGTWLRSMFRAAPRHPDEALRVDRITAWLYIGAAQSLDGFAALRERGVAHVVDLRAERADDATALAALGLDLRLVPILDGHPPTHAQFDEIAAWLDGDAGVDADRALFVHCEHGLTRAPTVAMALLMHRGLTLSEAHRAVFAARPEMMPTAVQLGWLAERETRAANGG